MGELGAAILTLQQHPQHRSVVLQAQHVPAQAAAVANLSGAGDTLVGGFAAAHLRGCAPAAALAVGVAAAALSVGCELNVPGPQQGLAYARVHAAAQRLLAKQAVWEFAVPAAAAAARL